MEIAEKVELLEDEFKILKAELKETLVSVRDFLLVIRPLPDENGDTINNYTNTSIHGSGGITSYNDGEPADEAMPGTDDEGNVLDPEMAQEEFDYDELEPEMFDDYLELEDELDDFGESEDIPSEFEDIASEAEADDEMPLDDSLSLEEGGNMKEREEGASQSSQQVNLLANLVHWVSIAKKDIGSDRLPGFLDVYGVSKKLPDGLKEFILLLADTLEECSTESNLADSWTRLTLELNGILTEGTPFHSAEAFTSDKNKKTQFLGNSGEGLQIITETMEVSQIDIW